MPIPFVDLKAQFAHLERDIRARIDAVLAHGRYIMGPEVAELERTLGEWVGVKHAISCSSGTDALLMPLMARGIGPGDAVFTTPFTFVATAEVISLVGATPVFVDIDPETFNIDPAALERALDAFLKRDPSLYPLPKNVSELTAKAVIPVDLFGLPADYAALEHLCDNHDLFLLEDAAQSFGGAQGGRRAGAFGDAAATSFFPAKPLGCYGDGGMIFTDSDELCDVMVSIRVHGQGADKYDNVRVGLNARIDTLQAAILLAKFGRFPEEIERRQWVADTYTRSFQATLGDAIGLPGTPPECLSAWAQYTIRLRELAGSRSKIQKLLEAAGVPTAVYYVKPLHVQGAYRGLGYAPGDFPHSMQASAEVLSLPFSADITSADIETTVQGVTEACRAVGAHAETSA